MIMTIGGDAHRRTHTFVVVDPTGRKIAEHTFAATTDGHLGALRWTAHWPDRQWALEDCRQVTRRLERDLLGAGERVIRVPTQLMAGARKSARTPGKSDPIDALSVARAALREPDLPIAHLAGPERHLKLLVDHRDDLVAELVRTQCRLHWHLHELMPEHKVGLRRLGRFCVLDDLQARVEPLDGPVAEISSELIERVRKLTVRINSLHREITTLVAELAPTMLALEGCGPMSAAKIVAEVAGVDRFRSRSAFARWNGTAPIPVWSSNERFRLNRGGTARSTLRSTRSRSPNGEGPVAARTTSKAESTAVTPNAVPSERSSAASPTRCSDGSAATSSNAPRTAAQHDPDATFDIGAFATPCAPLGADPRRAAARGAGHVARPRAVGGRS